MKKRFIQRRKDKFHVLLELISMPSSSSPTYVGHMITNEGAIRGTPGISFSADTITTIGREETVLTSFAFQNNLRINLGGKKI